MTVRDASLSILAFPFHDARKAEAQGVRWRDGHLLEQFSKHRAVRQLLVVDRPTSTTERLLMRSGASVRGARFDRFRAGSATGLLTQTGDRVVVLDIAVPDLLAPLRRGRGWWFDVFARDDVREVVERSVAQLVPGAPSVIAWTPTVWPVIRSLTYRTLVFDSLDNWISHPQLRRNAASAEQAYAGLLPRADTVIVSAPKSKSVLSRWAPEIEVIPNGVEPSIFQMSAPRPADLPHGPVVGYAGTLGPRIDVELVLDVAGRLPDVSFVFVGPDPSRRIADLLAGLRGSYGRRSLRRSRSNVYVLGDRHYGVLPGYVRHFDVAWIPHRVGEGESGGDPIKLYEYWAAGRPVVATRIDGLDRWGDRLHLVQDGHEAAARIQELLSGRIAHRPVAVPEDRTWASIADRMIGMLAGS